MLKQEKKVIGDTKYLVTQMDGIRALKAQTKLIKILGPAVASILTSGKLNFEVIKSKIFSELPEILSNFDDKIVNEFILSLFYKGVFKEDKNGHPEVIDFEIEFAGRINDMWKVALFILEVNFLGGKSTISDLLTTQADISEPNIVS
jgi:hypothetical protein